MRNKPDIIDAEYRVLSEPPMQWAEPPRPRLPFRTYLLSMLALVILISLLMPAKAELTGEELAAISAATMVTIFNAQCSERYEVNKESMQMFMYWAAKQQLQSKLSELSDQEKKLRDGFDM